jgi:hypothetical protein
MYRIVVAELPWGAVKLAPCIALDYGSAPGQFAAQSLLSELLATIDRKLQFVVENEPLVGVLLHRDNAGIAGEIVE